MIGEEHESVLGESFSNLVEEASMTDATLLNKTPLLEFIVKYKLLIHTFPLLFHDNQPNTTCILPTSSLPANHSQQILPPDPSTCPQRFHPPSQKWYSPDGAAQINLIWCRITRQVPPLTRSDNPLVVHRTV